MEVVAGIAVEVEDERKVRIDVVLVVAGEREIRTDVVSEVPDEGEVGTYVVAEVAEDKEVGTAVVLEFADEREVTTTDVVDVAGVGDKPGDVKDAAVDTGVGVQSSPAVVVVAVPAVVQTYLRDEEASSHCSVCILGLLEDSDPEEHVLDISRAGKWRGSKAVASAQSRKRSRTRKG